MHQKNNILKHHQQQSIKQYSSFNNLLNQQNLLYSSIGLLTYLDQQYKSQYTTAILISNNIILTTAHNIYYRKNHQLYYYQDFKFYLPHRNIKQYYQIIKWKFSQEYLLFNSQTNKQKIIYDYAIMKLQYNQKLPFQENNFYQIDLACQYCSTINISQWLVEIYGYPKIENLFELTQYGQCHKGRIKKYSPQQKTIIHTISTLPGQDGAGIIINSCLIGIHNGNEQQSTNIGRLITFDVLRNLQEWRIQLDGNRYQINGQNICQHYEQQYLKIFNQIRQQDIVIQLQDQYLNQQMTQEQIQQLKLQGYNRQNTNWKLSQQIYYKCLKLQQKIYGIQNIKTIKTLIYLGRIFQYKNNYKKALYYYKKVFIIYQLNHSINQLYPTVLINIGRIYQIIKQYNKAILWFQRALEVGIQLQQQDWIRYAANHIAICLANLQKLQQMNTIIYKYKLDSSKLIKFLKKQKQKQI